MASFSFLGSVGGWGDAAQRIAVSALGGCGAGKASGGSCSRGAKLAAIAQAVSIGVEKFTTQKPTYKNGDKGHLVKVNADDYLGDEVWNPCLDICDATSGLGGNGYNHVGIGNVTSKAPGMINENGWLTGSIGKLPGMDSGHPM